jgi:hypothetical protein
VNNKLNWMIGLSLAAFSVSLNAQTPVAPPRVVLSTTAGQSAPVVLELFTSQGCSSCPPAESLLNSWGLDLFQKGKLIPLAFHVDYWNNLGWSDPFSSVDFTARQNAYVPVLAMASLYTPQAVFAGQTDAVGSDAGALENRLKALATVQASTGLSVKAVRQNEKLELEINTTGAETPGSDWTLNVALFENGLVTPVARGENGGKTLLENFVVRSFSRFYPVKPRQTFEIPSDPAWTKDAVGVAVYLQDRHSLRIDSSAAVYPIP